MNKYIKQTKTTTMGKKTKLLYCVVLDTKAIMRERDSLLCAFEKSWIFFKS